MGSYFSPSLQTKVKRDIDHHHHHHQQQQQQQQQQQRQQQQQQRQQQQQQQQLRQCDGEGLLLAVLRDQKKKEWEKEEDAFFVFSTYLLQFMYMQAWCVCPSLVSMYTTMYILPYGFWNWLPIAQGVLFYDLSYFVNKSSTSAVNGKEKKRRRITTDQVDLLLFLSLSQLFISTGRQAGRRGPLLLLLLLLLLLILPSGNQPLNVAFQLFRFFSPFFFFVSFSKPIWILWLSTLGYGIPLLSTLFGEEKHAFYVSFSSEEMFFSRFYQKLSRQ